MFPGNRHWQNSKHDVNLEGSGLFTMEELKEPTAKLTNGKSSEADGITSELIKLIAEELAEELLATINLALAEDVFPRHGKLSE